METEAELGDTVGLDVGASVDTGGQYSARGGVSAD